MQSNIPNEEMTETGEIHQSSVTGASSVPNEQTHLGENHYNRRPSSSGCTSTPRISTKRTRKKCTKFEDLLLEFFFVKSSAALALQTRNNAKLTLKQQ